jgi:hypothetical protein
MVRWYAAAHRDATVLSRRFQTAARLVSGRHGQRALEPECIAALAADYDDAASRVNAALQAGGG